jgi:hypothetical protein
LLQEVWDSIAVQDRYLSDNVWSSLEFDARRWQIGMMIQSLQRFPPTRLGASPSVYVERAFGENSDSLSGDKDFGSKDVDILELANDRQKWIAQSNESKLVMFKRMFPVILP